MLILILAVAAAAVLRGADTRDGRDWQARGDWQAREERDSARARTALR